jgi:outer membrane protein assembly factor BamD (BamD/ComL family)
MRQFFLMLMLASASLLSACASLTGPGREVYAANNLVENKKYGEAVSIYRKVLRDHPDALSAADARFALATTLAYYENPQRDYAQALQEFDEFVRLYPDDSRYRKAQNWRHVLRALHDSRKSIEDLKKLDIRHEEKRKRK